MPRSNPRLYFTAVLALVACLPACPGASFYTSEPVTEAPPACGECAADADCERLAPGDLPPSQHWTCFRPDLGGVCVPQGPAPVCEEPPAYDCAETLDCVKLYPGDPPGGQWLCAKAPAAPLGFCSVIPTPADPQIAKAHTFGMMRCDEYDSALMLHACGAFMGVCNDPASLCADPALPVPVARAGEVLQLPSCAPTDAPACDFTAYGIATWITIDCCPTAL